MWQTALYFAMLVGILIFANWGAPRTQEGIWWTIYAYKWAITAAFGLGLAVILTLWFDVPWWKVATIVVLTAISALLVPGNPTVPFVVGLIGLTVMTSSSEGEMGDWFDQSWGFAKQILPLLVWGVLISGFLLGRPAKKDLSRQPGSARWWAAIRCRPTSWRHSWVRLCTSPP